MCHVDLIVTQIPVSMSTKYVQKQSNNFERFTKRLMSLTLND